MLHPDLLVPRPHIPDCAIGLAAAAVRYPGLWLSSYPAVIPSFVPSNSAEHLAPRRDHMQPGYRRGVSTKEGIDANGCNSIDIFVRDQVNALVSTGAKDTCSSPID